MRSGGKDGFDQESALKPKAVTKRFAISESSARRRVCSAEVLASRLAAKESLQKSS